MDIELESPSGVLISGAGDSNVVEFIRRDTYEIVVLRDPEPGEWTVRVKGVVVSGEEPFTVSAYAESASMMVALDADKISYVYPEKVNLRATVIAEVPVIGASVTGTATRPDGSTVGFTLFDDGMAVHGDDIPNDGVYSLTIRLN